MIHTNYYLRILAAILFGFALAEQPSLKPVYGLLAFSTERRQRRQRRHSRDTAETQRRHSGQTSAHVQRCNDHQQRNGMNAPYPPSEWTHSAAVLVCRLAITVDTLLGIKRSQTSYKQPHKSIIHGVLKAYNLFRWAQKQNGKSTGLTVPE